MKFSTKKKEEDRMKKYKAVSVAILNLLDRREESGSISKESLKPGDHIYSWRKANLYSHHGVYVGENRVIHFNPRGGQERTETIFGRFISSASPPSNSREPCPECGDHSNTNGVIKSCLKCFLSGGDLYLFMYSVTQGFFLSQTRGGTCTLANSDPPENVLQRATYLLEHGFGEYNLFKNNCEDFALYCKTEMLIVGNFGVGRSGQVSAYFGMALGFIMPSKGTFLSDNSRLWTDIGFRSDVIKLPVERLKAGLSDP